jgi:hypothetical protein
MPADAPKRPYFLLLLPVFFVLHGYTENFPLITAGDALVLLLRYLLATIVLFALFFALFRSVQRTAVFVFLLMAFEFLFGSMHDAGQHFLPAFLLKYTVLLPLILVGFVASIIYFKKTKRPFRRFSVYIQLLLLILLLIDFIGLGIKLSKTTPPQAALPPGFTKCDTCSRPDIYFIIADEYAGQRELQDVFGFDNSPFLQALRSRGFHVMDSSSSNYNYTPFSTASILSMDYLQGIEGHNQSKKDRHSCYEKINRNPVASFLRTQGYQLKNYSVFQFSEDLPATASPFVLTGRDLLTAQTFLSRLDHDVRFNLVTKYKIKSEIKTLGDAELASMEGLYDRTMQEASRTSTVPRFIYTHLMLPHYPYFYDSSGHRTAPDMVLEGNQMNRKAYISYLEYANKKFLALIDHILAHSKTPPMIIFMGDHGFRHFTQDVDHNYYFMNLDAVYLPSKNYGGFYPRLSAVNQFRVLFNTQFGQHLPLLKDSTSFLTE